MPSFEGNPHAQGHKILSRKTRDLEAAHGENFGILACTVLIQITSVTDRRMPRRWLRRMKHSAIECKKWDKVIVFTKSNKKTLFQSIVQDML